MKIIAGVECCKISHTVAFLDEAGRLIETLTISNSPGGFEQAIERASRLADGVSWGFQRVGSYGRAFAKHLLEHGADVFDVPPDAAKRYRTDATPSSGADATASHPSEASHDELRLYSDCRDRLVRDRAQVLDRMRHTAFRLGIGELSKALHRRQAQAGFRAQLDRIEVRTAVAHALVTELRFGVQRIEMLNGQIAEVDRILEPLVRHLLREAAFGSAPQTALAAG
jgi:transposase